MAPVVAVVAAAHSVLQRYAPSNILAAHVRTERPRPAIVIRLAAMAVALVVGAHLLATWAATGGPGWLNFVVLVAVWDAFKFVFLALTVILRRVLAALPAMNVGRKQRQLAASNADDALTPRSGLRTRPSRLAHQPSMTRRASSDGSTAGASDALTGAAPYDRSPRSAEPALIPRGRLV
jgi:hypothetical protein